MAPRPSGIKPIQLNDDKAEKLSRRRDSGKQESRRVTSVGSTSTSSSTITAPILANFETWMKMVKDNKINATNSWNFALIDYFHDLSLLREGDGINFQKASYTLDGCVKIYTSRIDSVFTEAHRLAEGLAKRKDDKETTGADQADDQSERGQEGQEGGEEGEGEGTKPTKKRRAKSGATLAQNYDTFRAKKLDLELAVDPLFRKMCADFDEGGANGLLLNSLMIDPRGRMAFDEETEEVDEGIAELSQEDISKHDGTVEKEEGNLSNTADSDEEMEDAQEDLDSYEQDIEHSVQQQSQEELEPEASLQDYEHIDLRLYERFIDLANLDSQVVCPSLPSINNALKDPNLRLDLGDVAKVNEGDITEGFGLGFGGNLIEQQQLDFPIEAVGENIEESGFEGFGGLGGEGDDDNDNDDGYEMGLGAEYNEPQNATVERNRSLISEEDNAPAGYHKTEDLLAYFDDALTKNWAGPEHWKVQRLKALKDPQANQGSANATGDTRTNSAAPGARPTRRRKEPVFIDFSAEDTIDDSKLFAKSTTTSLLPKSKMKGNNKLPEDIHFSSRDLVSLKLRPGVVGRIFSTKFKYIKQMTSEERLREEAQENKVENYNHEQEQLRDVQRWAERLGQREQDDDDDGHEMDMGGDMGPPMDSPDHDDQFYDADDMYHAPDDGDFPPSAGIFTQGTTIEPRKLSRPEYVKYARVAKRVDVKLLKENLWKAMHFENDGQVEESQSPAEKKLSEVAQSLKSVYNPKQMSDISTSFCFICMLHLANEQGLELEGNEEHSDVRIRMGTHSTE